jgi:hypothetical protein
MNDDNKIANQNIVPPSQAGQPQAQVQPVMPVSSPNKEFGSISGDTVQVNEISPSGAEINHEISQELKDIGVKEKEDRPNLTAEHKSLGIEHAGPHIPVSTAPSSKEDLPMTKEVADQIYKTSKNDDSEKWYARLIEKIAKIMGL